MSDPTHNRTSTLSRWQAPDVGPRTPGDDRRDLDSLRASAREQAFSEGYAQGLEAAQEQTRNLHSQLEAMIAALQQPLEAVDDDVIDRLTQLAMRVARRLVRRELRTNPSEVIAVVREALGVLPLGLRDIRVHLHPEDARLVSDTLQSPDSAPAWQIVEDPVITRGGCRVSSTTSQIDATVETRLARVINTVLGGERDEDTSA